MAERKIVPWSNEEVGTFLSLIADSKIQRELDGATRNEKVFQEVSRLMASCGYDRSFQQCREKLKKLKSDYRSIKDHNGRSGSNRKNWRWFDQMDSIYGHRPANSGREGGLDSATTLLESLMEDGKLSVCCFYFQRKTCSYTQISAWQLICQLSVLDCARVWLAINAMPG